MKKIIIGIILGIALVFGISSLISNTAEANHALSEICTPCAVDDELFEIIIDCPGTSDQCSLAQCVYIPKDLTDDIPAVENPDNWLYQACN